MQILVRARTLAPSGAYDSKTKDEATRVVYRSGDLETFAKSEQRLAEARFSAQLKSWVDQGLTDEQIRHKLENEPLAIALSTAGPNVGGRQPSGSGMGVPTFANARQTLLQIRALSKQASDFSVEVPSAVSAKDRQVTVTETVGYGKGTTNLRVSTGAENVVLYQKLKANLIGKEISDGHAFSKHVIKQGEFKNVNVSTREKFEKHIENVVNNYTSFKELSNGRSAYWHEPSGTVVIRNPKAKDGGTAFQPKDGRKYFDEKLK
ncbi:hypothetical protein [Glaesserella parasuis]|uniref:hypothetical protein n=1 Tax=Glaesserella parasuis TaxID=738 RepID=UPI00277942BE|nr:hypothetical protein [Glaesserella parasuis]